MACPDATANCGGNGQLEGPPPHWPSMTGSIMYDFTVQQIEIGRQLAWLPPRGTPKLVCWPPLQKHSQRLDKPLHTTSRHCVLVQQAAYLVLRAIRSQVGCWDPVTTGSDDVTVSNQPSDLASDRLRWPDLRMCVRNRSKTSRVQAGRRLLSLVDRPMACRALCRGASSA